MTPLHERDLELQLRGRVKFGVGAIEALPELVAAAGNAGGKRAFIVTDPGVLASGVIDRVREVLVAAGIEVGVYAEVEPNPDTASIRRGSAALAAFGISQTVIVPVGGGSSMDSAKAISLHAVNGGDVLALGYHLEDAIPGGPLIAIPTTAGTGAETNTYGVITDEAAGRKVYVGHPSLLPVWTILDPALTVGLPPGATAATGVDAMTHSLESLLSRNPNPFADRGDRASRRILRRGGGPQRQTGQRELPVAESGLVGIEREDLRQHDRQGRAVGESTARPDGVPQGMDEPDARAARLADAREMRGEEQLRPGLQIRPVRDCPRQPLVDRADHLERQRLRERVGIPRQQRLERMGHRVYPGRGRRT